MQKIKKKQKLELGIEDMVFGGNGISRVNLDKKKDFVIFVKNAIEGQRVIAEITKFRVNYAESKIIKVLEKSKLQKKINFQKISGAPYIELDIDYQRNIKRKLVFDVFRKIGKVENIDDYFDEFIASPKTWHYRNKMEYSFSSIIFDKKLCKDVDGFGLGFKKSNTWWIVENLDKDSGMFDKDLENGIRKIREYCKNTKLPAWNIPQKKGFFRNLNVRKSYKEEKLLIELVTSSKDLKKFDSDLFKQMILSTFKNKISGIIHSVNDDVSDRLNYEKIKSKLIFGSEKISENILNLDFEINMSSFFQTNPMCAELLYAKVLDYIKKVSLDDKKVVLDLFCGTGTISQIIASNIKNIKVIGVDIVSSSISNAKQSSKNNGISNVEFQSVDVGEFLIKNPNLKNEISTIILDPPRPGISKKSLKKIIELQSKSIIYVSCNPSTQARDVEILVKSGYKILKFSIVDQFPHTHHIETIFILKKSS